MQLPTDIDTWVQKTWPPREATYVRGQLVRFKSEQQIRDAHAYIVNLIRDRRTAHTILTLLQVLTRMASIGGTQTLAPPSKELIKDWANTLQWAKVPKPGTLQHKVAMVSVSKQERTKQLCQLEAYVRFHLIRQRMPVAKAKDLAEELVYQDYVDLPAARERKGRWLEAEQRAKMLELCPSLGLSGLHIAIGMYLVQVLPDTRARPLLRTQRKHCRIEDGLATVDVPRGFKNKKTVNLYHNRDQSAALLNVLARHPSDKPDGPLLPDPWLAELGLTKPLTFQSVNRLLRRLCGLVGLPYVGPQMFRRLGHNEAAASGASDHKMRLKFAHSPLSQMGSRYTKLGLKELCRIMDELQGKPAPGRFCDKCRAPYGVSDSSCRHCGHPIRAKLPAAMDADGVRLEIAAEMALAEH